MIELTKKQCKPCEGGTAPLTETEAKALLQQTPAWSLHEGGTEIHRAYEFKNYYQTMAFVNALAWIAHREDHHPDIEVGYKRCHVRYSTHSIGGLSENDFICAAKIDALVP
ncbi:MAG: 4a-hydroxytetrahydrobiopterin dehydratase [Gammaproteobacteria bacterium]|jgi:4a-hydroxytetrahydrobiopterin dehydratase|nr:4a-hydroxytetrahydrobiopterin dehydratase [Pseudomonadota bacterium]MCZ6733184.1 4a-hydroxytetrahydrobiopterin dehydratase [Gammaproteobacteria bacterium]TDJ67620.1 MAG: 4a-hydroxytetrahydrobiopterin dehydratase [Pseudomonadota bacterium]TDJ74002.1 MAG: 4a-hydroxytetrahydrobiopterin dehydratase [Pseudomonadota bacterium]